MLEMMLVIFVKRWYRHITLKEDHNDEDADNDTGHVSKDLKVMHQMFEKDKKKMLMSTIAHVQIYFNGGVLEAMNINP